MACEVFMWNKIEIKIIFEFLVLEAILKMLISVILELEHSCSSIWQLYLILLFKKIVFFLKKKSKMFTE